MVERSGTMKDIKKRKNIARSHKGRDFVEIMIAHVRKGHGTQKNKVHAFEQQFWH